MHGKEALSKTGTFLNVPLTRCQNFPEAFEFGPVLLRDTHTISYSTRKEQRTTCSTCFGSKQLCETALAMLNSAVVHQAIILAPLLSTLGAESRLDLAMHPKAVTPRGVVSRLSKR